MKKLLLMLTAVATLFTACNKDHNDGGNGKHDHSADLVGTWTCFSADYAEVLIIKADGTVVSYGIEDGEYWENVKGTVVVNGDNIAMTFEDDDNFTGHFDIVPNQVFSIYEDSGERYTYQYCANDLSEEVLGMWYNEGHSGSSVEEMAIQTYNADGTTIVTAILPMPDSYMLNTETTYKVVGDLMFTKVVDKLVAPDTEMYYASRLVYTPNGTKLGDIMTKMNYVSETQMANYSWLRIKQSLELANKNYDYSNIYVTNVKGEDKDFEFAGQTLNFSTLDGSVMDKLMKHILFNVSFTSGKISYNCYYNGANKSIDAPIEVDGNKVTIKMSENNSVYRDIEMYMFQDAKNTQLHMYMPTKSFEKFFGNISVATMAKEGKLDLNDASAVKTVFDNIENAIESINVSFIFKDPTRAL